MKKNTEENTEPIPVTRFKIGKRYFVDKHLDVSGIYKGKIDGRYKFTSIKGVKDCYDREKGGAVYFKLFYHFFEFDKRIAINH